MIFLIIDTSTERAIIGLSKSDQLIAEKQLPFGYQSSKYLFNDIIDLLTEQKINMEDLTAIAVSVGPGSFTGIRVGVSAAKGLSYARDLPLIGFNSLYGFIAEDHQNFVSIIDAKMGGAYVLQRQWQLNQLNEIGQTQKISLEKLQDIQSEHFFISPNSSQLQKRCPPDWIWRDTYPNMQILAQEIYQKYKKQQFVLDQSLVISY